MHTAKRLIAVAGLLVLGSIGSVTATQGAHAASVFKGHVYVNDNTSGTNTIAAFNRFANGSLTAIANSPFAAGGQGTGAGIGSQGSLQLSSDGRFLLAADAGSNQISVLSINSDGSLTPVTGSPVSSGGNKPVSIAVHGSFVYVANAGAGGSNYTGFTLSSGGALTPLSNSTFLLSDAANPGDVLFNSSGTNLIGTEVGTSKIDSFTVGTDGSLTAAAGSPFTAQGAGPFGSEFRPTNPTELYVSNAHNGGTNLGTVSAFNVDNAGILTSIGPSPYPDLQNAPCWVEISHDGRYLFAVNTASSSISSYSIQPDGSLKLLKGSTPFGGAVHGEEDARLDPTDSNLYVVDSGSNAVSAFTVSGGSLSELASSPVSLPTGAHPFGIVVD
ncbi:MAG TPA: beta-propeller fold lactonase family protein [Chloroflexota bacterium]